MKGATLKNETLNYKVQYKWGLVQKQAGTAKLTLTRNGDYFIAKLTARSDNWADKFYKLRDTLVTKMEVSDMLPVQYERIAHEKNTFGHDIIKIDKLSGGVVKGHVTRVRRDKKSEVTQTTIELDAQGATVDLLSSFYYVRNLDFSTMAPGSVKKINIFSGKKKELLTIKYLGKETVEIDGIKYPTLKISFTFSSGSESKSSDDIETWIWDNDSKIPVKMEGKLKIGKIRILYVP